MASQETDPTRATTLADVLASFVPIGLEELDRARLLDRVDTKYAAPEPVLPELLEAVRPHYALLEVADRRVTPYTTLYFDTPERACYRQHHNGRANRRKYRMRRYGEAGPAFFEVKLKTNRGRTVKRRTPIPEIVSTIQGEAAVLLNNGADSGRALAPQVWTRYQRITLVGRTTVERVTIDTELEFTDAGGSEAALHGVAIVEAKQERSGAYSPMRERLRSMGLRPLRVSKYCTGSLMLDPSLKRNRFKPVLRALQAMIE